MYIILLHITGIAIVEILFFFEYIGPIETRLFKDSLNRILKQSINDDKSVIFITLNQNITDIIGVYINDDQESIDNSNTYMENLNSEGVHKRTTHNHKLFIEILYYWGILCAGSLIVMIIQLQITSYCNKNKELINSDQNIELVHSRVRTTSIDTEGIPNNDIETNGLIDPYLDNNNNRCEYNNVIQTRNKILYYAVGVCLLLGFEYFFFEFIVLNYEPLSSYELQYILYSFIYKDTIGPIP